jgi:EmrB/QacA subfamily drug resistance transporter
MTELPVPLTQAPQTETAAAVRVHRRGGLAFAVIAVGAFMAQLDLFIVNIAFPAIHQSFPGSSAASLSWVLNVYAIVFAACLVPAGRLADLLGRRRTFQLGLVVFALASAACAAAPTLGALVGARAGQAVGAALLIPTSLGLLLHARPAAQRAGAIGAWVSVGAVAAAGGPGVGGLLVQVDWRLIFLVNIPLAVGALAGSWLVLEEVRHPDEGGLPDLVGIGLLILGVGGIVLCIVEGPQWGWASVATIGGLAISGLGLAAFIWRSGHHRNPVVELPLLKTPSLAASNAVMVLYGIAFGTMLLISVLFLTGEWHYSTLRAGLGIAPGPLTVAVLSLRIKHLVARLGPRYVAFAGCLFLAAGAAWWIGRLGERPDYLRGFLPGLLAGGVGVALTQATLFGVVAASLAPNRYATGTGILNMSRQIGLALGVAVLVALLGAVPSAPDFRRGFIEMLVASLAAGTAALLLPSLDFLRRPT